MTQFEQVLKESGAMENDDMVVAAAIVKSLAMGLFAMQVSGLIKFPAGDLMIGELESKVDMVAAAFMQKLIESKPS